MNSIGVIISLDWRLLRKHGNALQTSIVVRSKLEPSEICIGSPQPTSPVRLSVFKCKFCIVFIYCTVLLQVRKFSYYILNSRKTLFLCINVPSLGACVVTWPFNGSLLVAWLHPSLSVVRFYARKQLLLSARLSHRNSVCPSVCLSVHLSVTRVDQSKTVQTRITKFSPSPAWSTLVSGIVKLFHKFERGHPERGR